MIYYGQSDRLAYMADAFENYVGRLPVFWLGM